MQERYKYTLTNIQLFNDDCINIMQKLPDKSVDMILCDLPYGTTESSWDKNIPANKLWEQYKRRKTDHGREAYPGLRC